MKLFFAFCAMVFTAVSVQAVYVNWALSNSQYIGGQQAGAAAGTTIQDWTADIDYVWIYQSDTKLTDASKVVGGDATHVTGSSSLISATPNGKGVSVDAGDRLLENKYYYLVVFRNAGSSLDGSTYDYVVSEAVQYTGTGSNGFSNAAVSTEGAPDIGNFYMPDWMGGTWSAPRQTPEPTALALLALGIAGFALRRKAV